MAVVRKMSDGAVFDDPGEVAALLERVGLEYERWSSDTPLADDASAEQVLAAYAPQIERMKRSGGYATADVIDLHPDTENLEQMLARFSVEHTHDEDEVRYILEGRGLFHIHTDSEGVLAIEVGPGDLLRVPRGTRHWFNLCGERRIRAIRLFQDTSGWTPFYTESGVDEGYQPMCFGPQYVPVAELRHAAKPSAA